MDSNFSIDAVVHVIILSVSAFYERVFEALSLIVLIVYEGFIITLSKQMILDCSQML